MCSLRHHLSVVNSSHLIASRGGKSGLSNKPIFPQPLCLSLKLLLSEEPEAHASGACLLHCTRAFFGSGAACRGRRRGCSCSRTHCQTVFRHHVQRLQVGKGNKQFDPIWINSIALCLLNLSQRENGVSLICTCVRHRDENTPCNDRHRSQRPRCRSKARLDSRTLKTLQLRTGRGYVCRRTVVSRYP